MISYVCWYCGRIFLDQEERLEKCPECGRSRKKEVTEK